MRFLLIFLALTISIPVFAKDKKRKPANAFPGRIVTFVCRDSEDEEDKTNALGLIQMGAEKDGRGQFSLTMYFPMGQSYTAKPMNGTYNTVPKGYVFLSRNGELHLHPQDSTTIPGISAPQKCVITGQINPSS